MINSRIGCRHSTGPERPATTLSSSSRSGHGLHFDPVDFRARLLRRLLCRVVGDAGAAHAADERDQCHFIGDCGRRADRLCSSWKPQLEMARPGCGGAGEREHLRRLRGHPAHALDVQEAGAARGQTMAEAAHAQPAWVLLAYLVAGVCFILALRGLSNPESSRRGNRTGMVGMAIAVATTLRRTGSPRFRKSSAPWSLAAVSASSPRARSR